MDSGEAPQLQMFFLPFLTPGHMIPMVDMARLFASRGVNVTIITTPLNALQFQNTIDRDFKSGHNIRIHKIPLPYAEVGLPQGFESFNSVTSPEMSKKLFQAISLLQKPIDQFLQQCPPDCIVSDMFYPWTVDVAAQLGIPRLVFNGSSCFALFAADSIRRYKPHEKVISDTEPFVLPGLPGPIEMTKLKLPDWVRLRNGYSNLMDMVKEAEKRSYGVLVNSFHELELDYVDNYKKAAGLKAWYIGPVSLCNKETTDKAERGDKDVVNRDNCLKWLDSKEPNSVLYVSFGSMTRFRATQLEEIAVGLEASGHPFIWVVKKEEEDQKDRGGLLPEGFEERMMESKKGLIIRGWAPQVLILEHQAIGGIVSHCGWNSIIESVNAGLPMITWPVFAEQFYNEKLVVQVLGIGVEVGSEMWATWSSEGQGVMVRREKIEEAVNRLMDKGSEEAKERRRRVKELGEMGKKAVEGGTSYRDLTTLINELKPLGKYNKVM